METHSSILTWRIPWTEEPGRLQSIGSQRVRHNWITEHSYVIVRSHCNYKMYLMSPISPTNTILKKSTIFVNSTSILLNIKRKFTSFSFVSFLTFPLCALFFQTKAHVLNVFVNPQFQAGSDPNALQHHLHLLCSWTDTVSPKSCPLGETYQLRRWQPLAVQKVMNEYKKDGSIVDRGTFIFEERDSFSWRNLDTQTLLFCTLAFSTPSSKERFSPPIISNRCSASSSRARIHWTTPKTLIRANSSLWIQLLKKIICSYKQNVFATLSPDRPYLWESGFKHITRFPLCTIKN